MTQYKVEIEESGGSGEVQTLDIEANSEEEARQQARGQVRGVVKSITSGDDADADEGQVEPGPDPETLKATEGQGAAGTDPFGARTQNPSDPDGARS